MKTEHLNDRGNLINLWKLRSRELYKAAETVWNSDVLDHSNGSNDDANKIHLQYRPASLLMGLSLEVLLKAFIISEKPLSLGEKYPGNLEHHKLVNLSEFARLSLSDAETKVLNRLTAAIEWTSKYPVPRESDLKVDSLVRNDRDLIVFKEIYSKILEKFPSMLQNEQSNSNHTKT
jgi:hypothetical protein